MLKLFPARRYRWSGLSYIAWNTEYDPAAMTSKRHSFIVRAYAGGRYCIQLVRVDDRDKRDFARVVYELTTHDDAAIFEALRAIAASPDPEAYCRQPPPAFKTVFQSP